MLNQANEKVKCLINVEFAGFALFTMVCLLVPGCDNRSAFTRDADGRPVLQMKLKTPEPPQPIYEGVDLSKLPPDELMGYVDNFRSQGRYSDALIFQYWVVENSDGADGLYNLACAYALAGDTNASFYWLDRAIQREGVGSDWVRKDGDLDSVRRSQNWDGMIAYIDAYNEFWRNSGVEQHKLIVPSDYDATSPIPVLIGLHGVGADANSFIADDFYQAYADEMNVAFLGVSGTNPGGPRSFSWSENVDRDYARIVRSLELTADALTPDKEQIVLFGFSQGAKVAVEVAIANPDTIAGAMAFSPGGMSPVQRAAGASTSKHNTQGYVLRCGAEEHPGTLETTQQLQQAISAMGGTTDYHLYPGMTRHSFPPDFAEKLAEWFEFVVNRRRATE